jgi:hypothetical protein
MPASYTIIKSARLKYVRIWGKTDYNELETLFYIYIRDPDFQPDLRMLVDLRDMADAVTGLWEIARLKRLYQYAYNDAENAVDVVIVARNGIAMRVAKAFAMLMRDKKPLNIHVTRNWDDALARLGVSPGSIPGASGAVRGRSAGGGWGGGA